MANYGSVAGVAVLSRKYTDGGEFNSSSKPTSDQVLAFLEQISAALDVYLAGAGFVTPVTDTSTLLMLAGLANSYASEMVHHANSAGRFYTDDRLRAKAPFTVISTELAEWVADNAHGIEAAGADRTGSPGAWIEVRDTDESGNEIQPIFKRDDYGNPGWDR